MKAIKSDSDSDSDEQKGRQFFQEKNCGVTPSVAAPGVTHPSDATVYNQEVVGPTRKGDSDSYSTILLVMIEEHVLKRIRDIG